MKLNFRTSFNLSNYYLIYTGACIARAQPEKVISGNMGDKKY